MAGLMQGCPEGRSGAACLLHSGQCLARPLYGNGLDGQSPPEPQVGGTDHRGARRREPVLGQICCSTRSHRPREISGIQNEFISVES